jgi:hypothetical protein
MADKTICWNETLQSSAEATGNGTAMNVGGLAAVGLSVEGITSATVAIEGSVDGTNYFAVRAYNPVDGAVATTVTADGIRIVPTAGLDTLRARISVYATGTIIVKAKGTVAAPAWLTS